MLVVGVDHDVILHTLLPLVGKGVATSPVVLASGTTKLTKHLLALVGRGLPAYHLTKVRHSKL